MRRAARRRVRDRAGVSVDAIIAVTPPARRCVATAATRRTADGATYDVHAVAGDGRCLFRSVAAAMELARAGRARERRGGAVPRGRASRARVRRARRATRRRRVVHRGRLRDVRGAHAEPEGVGRGAGDPDARQSAAGRRSRCSSSSRRDDASARAGGELRSIGRYGEDEDEEEEGRGGGGGGGGGGGEEGASGGAEGGGGVAVLISRRGALRSPHAARRRRRRATMKRTTRASEMKRNASHHPYTRESSSESPRAMRRRPSHRIPRQHALPLSSRLASRRVASVSESVRDVLAVPLRPLPAAKDPPSPSQRRARRDPSRTRLRTISRRRRRRRPRAARSPRTRAGTRPPSPRARGSRAPRRSRPRRRREGRRVQNAAGRSWTISDVSTASAPRVRRGVADQQAAVRHRLKRRAAGQRGGDFRVPFRLRANARSRRLASRAFLGRSTRSDVGVGAALKGVRGGVERRRGRCVGIETGGGTRVVERCAGDESP